MFRIATCLALVLSFGCNADPGLDPERLEAGKGDETGSCAGTGCEGQAPGGSCYCDLGCKRYGDCCADYAAVCEAAPPPPGGGAASVPELGASPTFTTIATAADGLDVPRDLTIHPTRDQLWTINQGTEGITIVSDPGGSRQRAETLIDVMHEHFMSEPSAIAFGKTGTFATCQESINHGNHFMGPTLWQTDVYAQVNQEVGSPLLGSHIDMLHQSPLCMGIAHDHDNVYWVFDGQNGHVVRYDFQRDHGPGYDDHSDGIVRRYPEATLRRRAGVPGHLVLDASTGFLYAADTGRDRVIRLDTTTGTATPLAPPRNEPLIEYSQVRGATVEVFATGIAGASGLAIANGRLFVGSFDTGEIVAVDLATGAELGRVATGASGLMGLAWGQGKLWFADGVANKVVRIDP